MDTLKGGGTEKRVRDTKIFKKGGGKPGQRVGALKRGGRGELESPYELCFIFILVKLAGWKIQLLLTTNIFFHIILFFEK